MVMVGVYEARIVDGFIGADGMSDVFELKYLCQVPLKFEEDFMEKPRKLVIPR